MKPPSITKKQSEILLHISRFRFLDRTQLQRLHAHKGPTRIKDWLSDLTQKDYLGRIYDSSYGENTKPAIYYLKLNAIKHLREAGLLTKERSRTLYREGERSAEFVAHSMRVADICLGLQERNRHGHDGENPLYVALTAPELGASELGFLSELRPDLVIMKKDKTGKETYHLLVLLEPTLPAAAVRMRLRQIVRFYYAGTWEENARQAFPIVLLVCPTKPYLISTKRLARKTLEASQNPDDVRFRLALAENVASHGITGEIWE